MGGPGAWGPMGDPGAWASRTHGPQGPMGFKDPGLKDPGPPGGPGGWPWGTYKFLWVFDWFFLVFLQVFIGFNRLF